MNVWELICGNLIPLVVFQLEKSSHFYDPFVLCSYRLNLWTYKGPIQSGLRAALEEHPEIEAVLMGTRRTDPSGQNLGYFEVISHRSVFFFLLPMAPRTV